MEIIAKRLTGLKSSFQLLWVKSILIILMVPLCCVIADTCPNLTFESFKVANLSQCYWTFNASNQNCVGHSTTQTCIITMGFCRALQLNTGCQQSSLCVKTVTGTEKNETMYNAGEFQRNTNPYHTIPSSPNLNFIAKFNGSQYTRKDGTKCMITSEIHFNCQYNVYWVPSNNETVVDVPSKANPTVVFNQTTCRLVITVLYDGACQTISPTLPTDNNPSFGSTLIIIFVAVVSAYFLFGCTFKYCYGFRGREVLPHSDFWVDLPSLIVDGMVFTIKCGKSDMTRTYDGI